MMKISFHNGYNFPCGCAAYFEDGKGEYCNIIKVELCDKHSPATDPKLDAEQAGYNQSIFGAWSTDEPTDKPTIIAVGEPFVVDANGDVVIQLPAKAARLILEKLNDYHDRGPQDYGWHSKEMQELVSLLTKLLDSDSASANV